MNGGVVGVGIQSPGGDEIHVEGGKDVGVRDEEVGKLVSGICSIRR